jgi:poly-beta-1,6-N-acetyl-D-glucosamine synthase
MFVLECLFWISCFLIFFNYIGYALLPYIVNKLEAKKTTTPDHYFPSVSFVVAAYNEEDFIEKKIVNSLEQDYPKDKTEFIFITDGSTDTTTEICSRYSTVRVLHQPERKGKSAALNRAVEASQGEIIIFSDANTMLNKKATYNITRHYFNKKVGGVAGEKKVITPTYSPDEMANSEGLYWKYESKLKQIDSDFYSVVGAAGELFSVRKELYEHLPGSVILDDFVVSMRVAEKGYRVIYEPKAFATELPSFSIQDEHKRKVRIAAGGFQAIMMLPDALKFWKHFRLSYLYISHRVLRWMVSPFCLVIAFVANALLAFTGSSFYLLLLAAQLFVYFSAILVHFVPNLGKSIKLLKLPYYFVFMNISVIQGFFRFLRRKQSSTWEKARRSKADLLESHLTNSL